MYEVVYDNPKLRKEHGENGRKRVEEEFSNDLVSAAWLDFYKELLGNKLAFFNFPLKGKVTDYS